MLNHAGAAELEPFWRDVDPNVVDALDQHQRAEILAAVSRRSSENYPADVRLSLFGYFLVVIFGRERRSTQRRQAERAKRPVFTMRNLPLIAIVWGSVIYTAFSILLPAVKELLVLAL